MEKTKLQVLGCLPPFCMRLMQPMRQAEEDSAKPATTTTTTPPAAGAVGRAREGGKPAWRVVLCANHGGKNVHGARRLPFFLHGLSFWMLKLLLG